MQVLQVKTKEALDKVCAFFKSAKILGLDIETATATINPRGALEPRTGYISLIQLSDGAKHVIIDVLALFDEAGIKYTNHLEIRPVFEKLKELLESPDNKVVIHNAKFEHKWLMEKLDIRCTKVFDTFIADILLDHRRLHNLAAVAKLHLNIDLDKTEQKSDWGQRPLTKEQIEYATLDVVYLPALREVMLAEIIRKGLTTVTKIEFDVTPVIAKMENFGIKVNRERYSAEIGVLEKMRSEAERNLQKSVKRDEGLVQASLFGVPEKDSSEVLLTSSSQMKEALNRLNIPVFSKKELEQFNAYEEIESTVKKMPINERLLLMKEQFPKFNEKLYATYKKSKKEGKHIVQGTGAKAILAVSSKYDVLGGLTEFRGSEKLVSSYGENFLEFLEYVSEGHERIHPQFKQIGAGTGRFSCKDPNAQQVPAGKLKVGDTTHVVAFREAFDFPVGKIGINADYSQIELRIVAEKSGDQVMLATFKSGRDLHADTASRVFGVEYELCATDGHEYYKTYRKYAKTINFGIVYGMGADALSVLVEVSVEEAQEMIDKYSETYSTMWNWLKQQRRDAIKTLKARTASGRLQEFTPPSIDPATGEESRAEISQIGRNGANMPIQGLSADILKIAMKKFDDAASQYGAVIVNVIHDEIMVEAYNDKNLETVRKLLESCMIEAAKTFLHTVPVIVDAKVVNNWGEK